MNTITLLVIQEVRRAGGFAVEEVDRAFQTHPLIFAGLPISEAVALGALSFRVGSRATCSMMDLEAALNVGDAGPQVYE